MERWRIIKAFTLGPLIEATIPKPGNVNRFRDFEDLTFYHFLFAETAVIDIYYEAVKVGELLRKGALLPSEAGIGELIRRAVQNSREAQNANPNFGIITLSIPLMIALSMGRNMLDAREKVKLLIEESIVRDTMELYRAIRIANPKGIPSGVKYDVYSDDSFRELFQDGINLARLAEISCERELIFCEWLNQYELSYNTFARLYELVRRRPLEEAVQTAFLELLASNLDTLIIRKAGIEEAKLVQRKAGEVLEGKLTLEEFDSFMREKKDLRNPGSLADVMAVALSLLILRGYRFTPEL
ncbi:apo-citrate lyase phosphoribosyl-dephospho-CoA transferase [Thermococcus sp. GR7]|uniref:triphosphoribosyl-dephospho-CoA synthase n=1 Tax=unclassified Thermococcus TaxID=2627626 RepID=UPI001430CAD9|nr:MULTISPECIES: triphosphoribosyl-dephospho-CoA synthase [unclassified Thermococcus]NJE46874.1 apo-citrate lyase phosphoribosyl-dephospho-CoA transferase [Thermococcus sp. GR7]NJE78371.1 apo-citrate lyase phosphoribosyl-dephospho-CoA transferase [Thermococcus sp. GR4]NJF23332.1 apo-citrate lyase phosphoribosyl-dephospho-CoA transferase [Thermococcus sp. GR5]